MKEIILIFYPLGFGWHLYDVNKDYNSNGNETSNKLIYRCVYLFLHRKRYMVGCDNFKITNIMRGLNSNEKNKESN